MATYTPVLSAYRVFVFNRRDDSSFQSHWGLSLCGVRTVRFGIFIRVTELTGDLITDFGVLYFYKFTLHMGDFGTLGGQGLGNIACGLNDCFDVKLVPVTTSGRFAIIKS